MAWDMAEAIAYYKKQGAPGDQNALVALLREIRQEQGLTARTLGALAPALGVKESYLMAVVRRYPSLRPAEEPVLELCAGPNCGKSTALAALAERLAAKSGVTVRKVSCMRLCGKGPNLKWKGRLYHRADPALVEKLLKGEKE